MPYETILRPELASILARFPAYRFLIRRLFLANPGFRSLCDDYRLACDGLATFTNMAPATPRSEAEEYRTIVRELEAEIVAMLTSHGGPAAPDDTLREQGE